MYVACGVMCVVWKRCVVDAGVVVVGAWMVVVVVVGVCVVVLWCVMLWVVVRWHVWMCVGVG
jgi:hypothetical protein